MPLSCCLLFSWRNIWVCPSRKLDLAKVFILWPDRFDGKIELLLKFLIWPSSDMRKRKYILYLVMQILREKRFLVALQLIATVHLLWGLERSMKTRKQNPLSFCRRKPSDASSSFVLLFNILPFLRSESNERLNHDNTDFYFNRFHWTHLPSSCRSLVISVLFWLPCICNINIM